MKIWLFRAIALLIPVLFFVLLEWGLRIGGYGQTYPLFIVNPADNDYILPRPDLVKRYFAHSKDIPSVTIEANFLRKQKPENGLRFFVQGGSTAAGFPYGLGASVAGMLDHRLKQSFPDKYVEVINTALSAVNSYTVLDMVDEIIEHQPDAVLIYMGHNEYLGILGVGSNYTTANSQSTTLLFLKLKDLRIFQLLQQLYHGFSSSSEANTQDKPSRTFMAKVAKHKNIQYESDMYAAGIQQFEANLELILSKYRQANIPVLISTLTSNLLDQPPFSSEPTPAELARDIEQLAVSIKTGQADSQQLSKLSNKALQGQSAEANFKLGRVYYALSDARKAKQHLLLAKELDLLRFRAPEQMNHVIRALASILDAVLIDAQQRFEQRSRLGIVGNNLMLEHLHPNVEGYFLLSDAFYQGLKRYWNSSEFQDVEPNTAWKQRMILPSEEYFGFAKVAQLKTDYPFVAEKISLNLPPPQDWQQQLGLDLFSKNKTWLNMVQTAQQNYMQENNVMQLVKTQLLVADAIPYDIQNNIKAAELLIGVGQAQRAKPYLQRAIWAGDASGKAQRMLTKLKSG